MGIGVRYLIQLVQSFFSTWALMKVSRMEPGNVVTWIFFLLCFLFYHHQDKYPVQCSSASGNIAKRTAAWLSALFSLMYMLVDYHFYVENLTSPLFRFGIMVSVFTGLVILFYRLLILLFAYMKTITVTVSETAQPFSPKIIFCQKHMGSLAFILCMLCWLPYFLYQYPGIMTPDSINQFEQVLGVIPFSNHHPWVHTLVIKFFYSIGFALTGNMVVAISFYTVFQMCVMALTVAYLIGTLTRFKIRPVIGLVITLFYALVPYHAVYSITIWKDILFAAALLLFSCSILRMRLQVKIGDLIIFIIAGLMLCLFRSNGWYGMLLCLPFLLFYFRSSKKRMFPAVIGIFLIAIIVKYPVMNACHVTPPDFIESLSIPTQQVAAVICNHRELTDEQLELVENVVDLTYIDDLYVPYFADNMKELVRAGHQDYLVSHKPEFFKLWVQLGCAYPLDYLKAYIAQTYGYWYPDSFYLVADGEGVSATKLGVSHTPLIRGPLVIKLKELSIKMGSVLPLYGTIWSMGVVFWALLICMGIVIVRKEKHKLILYLPSLALIFTVLIATPVATEFRYVYFMIFALPFYILVSVLPDDSAKVPLTENPVVSDIVD